MGAERLCQECNTPLPANAPEGLCPTCLLGTAINTPVLKFHQGDAPDQPGSEPAGAVASNPLSDPALLAQYFPQLEILELLGQGGMGAVFKARQPALDRLVALKVLPRQTANEKGFAERFAREARALARLSHPGIVAVYEFGQTHGLHYLILEHVDGLNLRQLERAARLTPQQALQIVPQLCEALQFAHDQGVVHRDIKPENVLVDKKGRAKITDFGLAKLLGTETHKWRLTGAADVMGTPHYMAPEQLERPQEVDHRADIYSLGVVFYEMLTGELPLGKFAPPSQRVALDARLDEVVLHALEKEPERRYQQASQVKLDVETIVRGGAPAGTVLESGNHPQGTPSSAAPAPLAKAERNGKAQPEIWKHAFSARVLAETALVLGIIVYLAASRVWTRRVGSTPPPPNSLSAEPLDLLQRYPTTLTVGDTVPERAREWEFTEMDIFRVTRFRFQVGQDLVLELGAADLGLGHCSDGAVWAVLIPKEGGKLLSPVSGQPDIITQVWLRFHPHELGRLFPRETVFCGGATNLWTPMRAVARQKIFSSWQSDGRAMIPPPNELTVDVETKQGVRRFFMVDTRAERAEYVPYFENR